jgi:hypothetical protein
MTSMMLLLSSMAFDANTIQPQGVQPLQNSGGVVIVFPPKEKKKLARNGGGVVIVFPPKDKV